MITTEIMPATTDNLSVVVAEKFAITTESLTTLVNGVKDLRVNGVDDRDGLKKVNAARMTLKNKRVEIEKHGKTLRDGAVKFQKAVIDRQNELTAIIEPVEDTLHAEENRIASEREALRVAEEKRKEEALQARVNELSKFNYAHDFFELRYMSDDLYNQLLTSVEADFNASLERKAEEARISEAQRMAKEKADAEERERLAKISLEQEAERKRLEDIRLNNERREAELKAQQEQIERERRELEEQKQRELDERFRREEEERVRTSSIANNRHKLLISYGYEHQDGDLGTMPEEHFNVLLEVKRESYETEQRRIAIEKAEAERVECERQEKAEAERRESLKPDKEKLWSLLYSIKHHVDNAPDMNTEDGKHILREALRRFGNTLQDMSYKLNSL